jgi:Pet100
MAKGRPGFALEAWKFGVYLLVPITASIYFNSPENQKKAADYWQYVKYPPNPSTGWKEQIELISTQKEQREAYRRQLQQLNAVQESNIGIVPSEPKEENGGNWWRWLGIPAKGNTKERPE